MLEIVQEIGAAAGFAAVPGLAALTALYVSQAREVERLREWAGRAPERTPSPPPPITRPASARIGARFVALALAGRLLLGGAGAYGITRVSGDDPAGPHADKPKRAEAPVDPGDVTVAVLNGTTVPGLAAALRDRLAASGFKKGAINDFSDQQLAESLVQYAPGHLAEAKAVGRRIGITRREPVTTDSRALAGDAPVIVIAGADKAP